MHPTGVPSRFRAVGPVCAIGLALAGSYAAARLAWIDHLERTGSAEALAEAVRRAPRDAALWSQLGAATGDARALERAAALNPWDSATWIALGEAAEARQDFARAERCYRAAARASRLYLPRWTLANYYHRRDDAAQFRDAAREALKMAYGDPAPLFRLCWRASPDAGLVLSAIAGRHDMVRLYMSFLAAEGHLDAAGQAAGQLLETPEPADVPDVVAYCDRSLEAGRPEPAREAWDRLCGRGLLPYRPVAQSRLTNGDFAVAPRSQGFDWRIVPWDGIAVARSGGALRIGFSGAEPDDCQILTQYVPVAPGGSYRLSFEYRTERVAPDAGLRWLALAASGAEDFTAATAPLASERWARGEMRFAAPAGARLARLVLTYDRAPGTKKIEGTLWLRNASLE